jgi:hypothetical protein
MTAPLRLSRDLPAAVRLTPEIDPAAMRADLEQVSRQAWRPEEPYRFDGFFTSEIKVYHNGEWVGLSLRSQGGRIDRTDPGGPGLEDFADTPLMRCTPRIAELIGAWGLRLRSVRLLRLPPGGSIAAHRDTYHGFEYGQVRLHLPIVTNDGVETHLRDDVYRWREGELWYGDFGSMHSVVNAGAAARVHLVIDALITPAVLDLFPDDFRAQAAHADILFDEEPRAQFLDDLEQLECTFNVPSTLVRGIFDVDDGIVGQMESKLRVRDGALLWHLDGRDVVRLIPLEGRRLMFTGWTMERYFRYQMNAGRVSQLELILRHGRERVTIAFPVR